MGKINQVEIFIQVTINNISVLSHFQSRMQNCMIIITYFHSRLKVINNLKTHLMNKSAEWIKYNGPVRY